MYLIRAYLVAYFVLVAGAVLALWQAGVLSQIPVVWTSLGVLIAVLLGVLLAATSRHPRLPVD